MFCTCACFASPCFLRWLSTTRSRERTMRGTRISGAKTCSCCPAGSRCKVRSRNWHRMPAPTCAKITKERVSMPAADDRHEHGGDLPARALRAFGNGSLERRRRTGAVSPRRFHAVDRPRVAEVERRPCRLQDVCRCDPCRDEETIRGHREHRDLRGASAKVLEWWPDNEGQPDGTGNSRPRSECCNRVESHRRCEVE